MKQAAIISQNLLRNEDIAPVVTEPRDSGILKKSSQNNSRTGSRAKLEALSSLSHPMLSQSKSQSRVMVVTDENPRAQNKSAHSRRSKFSDMSDLSPDVKMRITGNYDKDRKICSSHKHRENSVKSETSEIKVYSMPPKSVVKSSHKKLPGVEI